MHILKYIVSVPSFVKYFDLVFHEVLIYLYINVLNNWENEIEWSSLISKLGFAEKNLRINELANSRKPINLINRYILLSTRTYVYVIIQYV